jgi:hypothetical protein
LVYYIPDSRYISFAAGSDAEYIQPAWRFYGHYSDGGEFEICDPGVETSISPGGAIRDQDKYHISTAIV